MVKKTAKKFLCWIGFHSTIWIGFDGISIHVKCRWCGKIGMMDSQGNLF